MSRKISRRAVLVSGGGALMAATANVLGKVPEPQQVLKKVMRPAEGVKTNVGVIMLSTDEIGADALSVLLPRPAVRLYFTRTAYLDDDPVTGEFRVAGSYKQLAETFPERLDILALSCTSATVATGADRILTQLEEARPGIKYTTPGVGGIRALRFLGAKKIALLTPYSVDYHVKFLPFFQHQGFQIVSDATYNTDSDAETGELTKEALFEGARALTRSSGADAIFISCTATPIVPYIEELETQLKIPVVTSTQALAWDILRLAGLQTAVPAYGRLMRSPR